MYLIDQGFTGAIKKNQVWINKISIIRYIYIIATFLVNQ